LLLLEIHHFVLKGELKKLSVELLLTLKIGVMASETECCIQQKINVSVCFKRPSNSVFVLFSQYCIVAVFEMKALQ